MDKDEEGEKKPIGFDFLSADQSDSEVRPGCAGDAVERTAVEPVLVAHEI